MEVQRILYVAGPYQAPTVNQTRHNVRDSEDWSEIVLRYGWGPIDPLATTAFMDGLVPVSQFLAVGKAILKRLRPGQDGILLRHGWEDSKGATGERDLAVERGLLILYANTLDVDWLAAHRFWPDIADELGT